MIKGFQKGMKGFGQCISIIVNTALLLVVYILGVGITSIVAKIVKKNFLDMKISDKSYWSDLDLKKKHVEEYYRQF